MKQLPVANVPHDWFGYLTVENLEVIGKAIYDKIKDRRYTWVAVNEYFGPVPMPEVRTGQMLKPEDTTTGCAFKVWYDDSGTKQFGGFHFCDTYGVWGLSTHHHDGEAFEHESKPTFISFERDQIKIEHRAPAGHQLRWVVALEPELSKSDNT